LQNVVRRRGFDAAFNMALFASQGITLSNMDSVTGGYNRRHITSVLEQELGRLERFHQPLSLILFDLDNFKSVNDTLGHAAGDEVLCEVHLATVNAVRGIDTVARLGGDEFAVVLPGTGPRAANYAAQRLRECVVEQLQRQFGADSLQAGVTISLGLACFESRDILTVESALGHVDALLYTAKRNGKNRTVQG
jgi:diguanylate cyclase (GGDEF)-like protein